MGGETRFGRWMRDEWGLPAFRYECDFLDDPDAEYDTLTNGMSRLHWHKAGNDRLSFQATNEGWIRLYEASRGRRWWHDRAGYAEIDGLSTADAARPPRPTWGIGYARYVAHLPGLRVDRLIAAPHGDHDFLVCRTEIKAAGNDRRELRWTDRWPLRPLWLSGFAGADDRRDAAGSLEYQRVSTDWVSHITETWGDRSAALADEGPWPLVPAPGAQTWFAWLEGRERLRDLEWVAGHRALSSQFRLWLAPGEVLTLWSATGVGTVPRIGDIDAEELLTEHFETWRRRLATARVDGIPDLGREIGWSAAATRQASLADDVTGHTFIDQGGCYADTVGASNCRDTAQHALALLHVAPEVAAESLCHSLATADADGEIDYAYFGAGIRHKLAWDPSDLDLWLLWLGTEYVCATGDAAILDREVACWPSQAALDMWPGRFGKRKPGPVLPVRAHLRLHLDHLIDVVGVGRHGHIRIKNADWNDSITMDTPGAELMASEGESVFNTALARWVLPRYAAMCRRTGDVESAERAQDFAESLIDPLARAFVGTHYIRAYRPRGGPIGVDHPYLEPQPWAILAGDAGDRAGKILDAIDAELCQGSPLGARLHAYARRSAWGAPGEATSGGIWPAMNQYLVWAAARLRPRFARDELARMMLANHAEKYPDLWYGIWGGPDAWNAPESDRPGETWFEEASQLSAQESPVANTHVHSDVVAATVRLFGVELGADAVLRIDPTPAVAGGRLRLPNLHLDVHPTGRRVEGQIKCLGPMELEVRGRSMKCEPGWNLI